MESMNDFTQELNSSFRSINEGDIITGTVIGISETEVILDLNYYTDGIISISNYSNDPSFSVKADVQLGDEISATVINPNHKGHILLSRVAATNILAWDSLRKLKDSKAPIIAKVKGIVNSGVITYVEGIRGFIPASKLSLNYVEDLNEWLNKDVTVQIITLDEAENKLVLSAKELLLETANEERKAKISNVKVGLVTEGIVESLMPYGAFVNIGNGLSGLVHISQISNTRIKHPSVILNEGDTVKVKIIDIKDGKLSLSMKALEDVSSTEIEETTIELPTSEEVTTSLGSLFKNLKLN